MWPPEDEEEVEHEMTMKERKAWLKEKAAAHRAAYNSNKKREAAAAPLDQNPQPTVLPMPPVLPVLPAPLAPEPPPTPPLAATAGTSRAEPSQLPSEAPIAQSVKAQADDEGSAQGAASALQQLSLAGGDIPTLAALATGDSRSELTTALKALGFKGMRARVQMEAELKQWQASHC